LIYIIDPSAHVPLQYVDTGTNATRLAALKALLRSFTKGHIVNYFISPQDLAAKFSTDLVKAVNMFEGGDNPSGLKNSIEKAIADCTQFV